MINNHLDQAKDKSALARTCKRLYMPLVGELYKHNVQRQDADALVWAVQSDTRINTLKRLHAHGADVTNRSEIYRVKVPCLHCEIPLGPECTPFSANSGLVHLAARFGQPKTVSWLLDHGVSAEVTAVDDCPCGFRRAHDVIPSIFVRRRTAPPLVLWSPQTCTVLNSAICGAGNLEVVRLLTLDHQVSPVVLENTSVTALHVAAFKGHTDIAAFLVRHGLVNVNAAAESGSSPLHYACRRYNNGAMVATLVELGADLHAVDGQGITPFMTACVFACLGTARALLDAGANGLELFPRYVQALMEGPIHCLCSNRERFFRPPAHRDVRLDTLPRRRRRQMTPHAPVKHDQWETDRRHLISTLVARGADINAATPRPMGANSPLMHAVRNHANPPCFLRFLLEHGAQANQEARDYGRTTALHSVEDPAKARALLAVGGARLDVPNALGNTPLSRAVNHAMTDMAERHRHRRRLAMAAAAPGAGAEKLEECSSCRPVLLHVMLEHAATQCSAEYLAELLREIVGLDGLSVEDQDARIEMVRLLRSYGADTSLVERDMLPLLTLHADDERLLSFLRELYMGGP
ncbi:ankyrin repeat-containing domain protein [Chaetomidium leptoderma]|uniref:Ankyrin repeat-containing domain protein n=1 Tax=Chaetomidium leptoderma TaxID=669021 RepID=A0AAN6VKQ6_9PEZI|nr:ankyrin repeat-containing domain protein [Chaetomidium leptoderma]